MNLMRRAWRWLTGNTEPGLYDRGRAHAATRDLDTEPARPPEALEVVRQAYAAREHDLGADYHQDAVELARDQAREQREYDRAVRDLEIAASRAQVAVREQDKRARSEAAAAEVDARDGRSRLSRHPLLPHGIKWAYLALALPGELAFMAIGFVRTDTLKVDILGHTVNLGYGTALTMGAIVLTASYVVGAMTVVNLRYRQRGLNPDPLVRISLVGFLVVGVVFMIAMPALRVHLDNQAHTQAVQEAQSVLGDSFTGIAAPNSTQTFLTFAGIYAAFFTASALLSALTFDHEEMQRRKDDEPLADHAAAVDAFVDAETALQASHDAVMAAWRDATNAAEGLGRELQQEIAPFFDGLEVGYGRPLPQAWVDLRRVSVMPAPPQWRNQPLATEPRLITPDRRRALLTVVDLADRPPLRPADRLDPDGPVTADATTPHAETPPGGAGHAATDGPRDDDEGDAWPMGPSPAPPPDEPPAPPQPPAGPEAPGPRLPPDPGPPHPDDPRGPGDFPPDDRDIIDIDENPLGL